MSLLNKISRYLQKAEQHSVYLHDQPMTPLGTAVYWTEYILRHRGAPKHMQGTCLDRIFQSGM